VGIVIRLDGVGSDWTTVGAAMVQLTILMSLLMLSVFIVRRGVDAINDGNRAVGFMVLAVGAVMWAWVMIGLVSFAVLAVISG